MNVFHKYTRASLKQNRSRTLVTIIGIVLSVALFTAVLEGAYSGQQFLVRCEVTESGAWHGYYHDLTAAQAEQVREDKEIKDLSVWQDVGWAEIGSVNEYKPYLYVQSIDDRAEDLVAFRLLDGRMPENDGELLLPDHLAANGDVHYQVGDQVTLDLGFYTDEAGNTLGPVDPWTKWESAQKGETFSRTYTVVGICARMDFDIEDFGCVGYYAFTKGGGTGDWSVFFTVKHPGAYYDHMAAARIADTYRTHSYLLDLSGTLKNPGLSGVLYGFAGVLVFLIAFGSISLIYNAFSISVSERTRQFGILKSVGATKKQIRGTVLYEALVLCLVAIPIGLVLGCCSLALVLRSLRNAFALIIPAAARGSVEMRLALNPVILAVAVALSLLTTLISAWIPAVRALRISPIQAIRQTRDVKLRKRDVRTWGLTQKLFGFEGMMASKNFGRNRKRYRAVIISLFLSVVLFVSASSFSAYLNDVVRAVVSEGTVNCDLSYLDPESKTVEEKERLFRALESVEGVEQGTWYTALGEAILFPIANLDKSYQNATTFYAEDPTLDATILFLRDETFRELLKENGLDSAPYFDPASPAAVALKEITISYYQEDGMKWETFTVLDPAALPATGNICKYPELEGYLFIGWDEAGNLQYYPEQAWSRLWEGWNEEQEEMPEPDPALLLIVEPEKLPITVAGLITKPGLLQSGSTAFILVYPASMQDAVLAGGDFGQDIYTHHRFVAPAHAAVAEEMEKVLLEQNRTGGQLSDLAADNEAKRMFVTVVNVFAYGFIIVISLIATANVFNTISTSVALRRREFAMLRSVGMGNRSFRRMMNYECLIYGVRSLLWGLPASVVVTWVLYRIVGEAYDRSFYVPWYSVVIVIVSVFLVVFASMLYATRRIKRDNPIDALKTETL